MSEPLDITPPGQCASCKNWDDTGMKRDIFGCPQPCTVEQKVRESFDTTEDWLDHMAADDCPLYEDQRIEVSI